MKSNFMKINATTITKKIKFRTYASVLVIQIAVFGVQPGYGMDDIPARYAHRLRAAGVVKTQEEAMFVAANPASTSSHEI